MEKSAKLIESYFNHERRELISLIPRGPNKVLDVGCAEGKVGYLLKEEGRAAFVAGLEVNKEAADVASRYIDYVICADAESLQLTPAIVSNMTFDYILFGDVLEHLNDPWKLLNKVKSLLKPNGQIIISIPNVRHITVVGPLFIRGRWTYRSEGILDIKHLRFFTRLTAHEMIEEAGYIITSCRPLVWELRDRIINALSLGLLNEFLAQQWIFTAKNNVK